ncbi:GTPase HflX [Candidatus Thorarchaeota archaeon]|nr:MAG: GTPase HflX [Candidatus Thorarchaeota archaeon]
MSELNALLVQRRRAVEPDLMHEFRALVETAGYTAVGTFDVVGRPSARFGIRTGKVEEIRTWIEIHTPDVVFFSPSLKSSQVYRLMEEWGLEVRDRTQLILEIFYRHARTRQAQLQIEQARLKYELPFERHQIRMRLQKEHTGDRPTTDQVGIGEDLLNIQLQHLRRRISTIGEKLEKISQAQELKRKKRVQRGYIEVAIAGYTNAGKSTLHNALTESGAAMADELFTTLSTKTTALEMEGRQVVLSDSVGFISDLPRSLLKAFNTTLMVVSEADVIVLVVDGADQTEEIDRKVSSCFDTFNRIEANGIPVVMALNKTDLLDSSEIERKAAALEPMVSTVIPVSAKEGVGLENLLAAIDEFLPRMKWYEIRLHYGDGGMSILSWLHEAAIVDSEDYTEEWIQVRAKMQSETASRLSAMMTDGDVHLLESEST